MRMFVTFRLTSTLTLDVPDNQKVPLDGSDDEELGEALWGMLSDRQRDEVIGGATIEATDYYEA